MKLILLRHGESEWNLKNKFTGWKDVKLTKNGKKEALFAAHQLSKLPFKVNKVFCSELSRSKETCKIVCNEIGYDFQKVIFDWRLNERHYGALQGLNKSETAKKYGEDQVKIWRRSYKISPPHLEINDKRHVEISNIFKKITNNIPLGESLKNVVDRVYPFWDNLTLNSFNQENYLIVAHSNSLRAFVKIIEKLSSKEIADIEIPTGVPIVYSLNLNFKVKSKKFLLDQNELLKRQEIVRNQGRAK